jgi:hypothetical protein
MRPGGRPKSYKSGQRWAKDANSKAKPKAKEQRPQYSPYDFDHDGVVSPTELLFVKRVYVTVWTLSILFLICFFTLAYLGLQVEKVK